METALFRSSSGDGRETETSSHVSDSVLGKNDTFDAYANIWKVF